MSSSHAIKQREQMISNYKKKLETETSESRIASINEAIKINKDEIEQIKKQKRLFGKAEPIKQNVTIVEYDRSYQAYKTTIIPKEKGKPVEVKFSDNRATEKAALTTDGTIESTVKETVGQSSSDKKVELTPSNKKVGNKLRDTLEKKVAEAKEKSLQAKVEAAKEQAAKDATSSKSSSKTSSKKK